MVQVKTSQNAENEIFSKENDSDSVNPFDFKNSKNNPYVNQFRVQLVTKVSLASK